MKRLIPVIILSLLAITLAGCRRVSDNGRLDGLWKIREIEYTADGATVCPANLFFGVQLELFQCQSPTPRRDLTGILHYHKGSDSFTVEFPNKPTRAAMADFGLVPENEDKDKTPVCRLDIEHASGSRLVLRSPIAVITCHKY